MGGRVGGGGMEVWRGQEARWGAKRCSDFHLRLASNTRSKSQTGVCFRDSEVVPRE